MSAPRLIPSATIEAQRAASDPRATAWVSANAGSGKTHVLAQRVIRLLLDGAPPSKILCLTYTKAAAANMAQRVFDTLARWTALDEEALERAIADTGALVRPHHLAVARKLFARAVETPGGLKIQTIHAFCERLLHQFPFEANLPSRFELLEDREKAEMLEAARIETLALALAEPDGELGRAVASLSASISESSLKSVLREALMKRDDLRDMAIAASERGGARAFIASRLGLARQETRAEIDRLILEDGIPTTRWAALAERLAKGSVSDNKLSEKVVRALAREGEERIACWIDVFLTQKFEPRGMGSQKIITRPLYMADPSLLTVMETERDRIVALLPKRRAAIIAENSAALFVVADRVLQLYQRAKNARALVDFDDLIERTLALLSRFDAGWVLYKLDAGIDHILVDEAQDTSPAQWEILRRLADEFASGAGARDAARTLFAVGDEKQSIYSFQGARPESFAEMKAHFKRRAAAANGAFNDVKLNASFRSAPGILAAVDAVFEPAAHRTGLSADDVKLVHEPLKLDLPGHVEIWDVVKKAEEGQPQGWRLPLDAIDPGAPALLVAGDVARLVAGWLRPDSPERVMDSQSGLPRPIRAGDVIVLVRTRAAFFDAVIRAFKNAGVPVAGADRLKFTQHIAVMDLVAAGRAALLPQDDLTLACALKSPLIGLDDDDLIALAPHRSGSLANALEASTDVRRRRAAARLALWRARAQELTPFGFYSLLLGADGGRRDLVARLGPEAGDAIDEFINQTLLHERTSAPSLAAFLAALESVDSEVKRDMDSAGDAVRVMTVHAAKGLESKIVILPDTCSKPAPAQGGKIFTVAGDDGAKALIWSPRKHEDAPAVTEAREATQAAADDEYRRLLYVALTRAEERLYIMGFEGRTRSEGCWYDLVRSTLEPRHAHVEDDPVARRAIWRRIDGAFPPDPAPPMAAGTAPAARSPAWLRTPARAERDEAPPVRPSTALAAADAPPVPRGPPGEAARIGILVHALLQHLPSIATADRPAAAARFLALRAPALDASRRAELASRALAVLATPALAPLFAEGAQAEVSLAGRIEARPGAFIDIVGQIDRLAVTGDEVLVADFKTGAPRAEGETPPVYLAQLALYRAALAAAWPGRRVRMLLVWTDGPTIVEPSAAALDAALARVAAP